MKLVNFDRQNAARVALATTVISLTLTGLNALVPDQGWVESGQYFIFFVGILVGLLPYSFATLTVFSAGQNAWERVVEEFVQWKKASAAMKAKREEKLLALLERHPDPFPIALMGLGWLVLATCFVFVIVPVQMLPILFLLNFAVIAPIFLALDYWGYKSGIKRVEVG